MHGSCASPSAAHVSPHGLNLTGATVCAPPAAIVACCRAAGTALDRPAAFSWALRLFPLDSAPDLLELQRRSCQQGDRAMSFDASVHAKAADLIKLSVEMTTAADS